MSLGDVVDQFHNQDSLADSGTAEETNLTTLGVRGQQVDDLNASDEDFLLDTHLNELWSLSVDGGSLVSFNWTTFIDGLTNDVHDASQCFGTDWDTDGRAGISDFLATNQTLCSVHSNGTDGVFSQVLGDFKNQARLASLDFEGVQDWWQVVVELHVNDGTDDGNNLIEKETRWTN